MNDRDRQELQQYLDGTLSGEARAKFEARLAGDSALAAEHALQVDLAASLRRTFTVPDITVPDVSAPDIATDITTPSTDRSATPMRRWPWVLLGAAAATVLIFCGLAATGLEPWRKPVPATLLPEQLTVTRGSLGRSWLALYQQPSGVQPIPEINACSAPDELPEFLAPLAPNSTQPVAWTAQPEVRFCRGLETDPFEGHLRVLEFAFGSDEKIMVFVVRDEEDPRPVLPSAEMFLFRAALGPLVLYELTPLDHPRVFPGLGVRGERVR